MRCHTWADLEGKVALQSLHSRGLRGLRRLGALGGVVPCLFTSSNALREGGRSDIVGHVAGGHRAAGHRHLPPDQSEPNHPNRG